MNTRTLASAVLVLGLSACADQMSAVAITAICAPPTPTTSTTGGASCSYSATCDAVLVGNPELDATTARLDFRMPLQFSNQLTSNASTTEGRVNTNDATIQSLEMTYAGGPMLEPWNVAVSVPVPTNGTFSAAVPLLPVQYFPTIAPSSPAATAHLIISVRGHGIFSDGTSFITGWFQVPVDVCSGCRASMAACAVGTGPIFCPPQAVGQVSPGQTAAYTCVTIP